MRRLYSRRMPKPILHLADIEPFLRERYEAVTDLELLQGGAWSAAFGFRAAGRPLVVRFGQHAQDYEKDRMAGGWARSGLPAPRVMEIGVAFDGVFAVSQRLPGDKLDTLPPARLVAALDSLLESLGVLHGVEVPGEGYGALAPDGSGSHRRWRDFLLAVRERDDERLRGWRQRLAAAAPAQAAFDQGFAALAAEVHQCADQRRVIHSDLLYGNVLVGHDNRISAIFDWGNALIGDPLYDIAWLIFWSPWYPGMDAAYIRQAAAERFGGAAFAERLRCYQLHIALDGLQYQAFAGLHEDLAATVRRTLQLLRES